jgi:hypothetical protein
MVHYYTELRGTGLKVQFFMKNVIAKKIHLRMNEFIEFE